MTKKLNVATDFANIFFGVEIEMGIPGGRNAANQWIGEALRSAGILGRESYNGKCYDTQGRMWKIVSDGSVGGYLNGTEYYGGELVTPCLTVEDIPALQAIVRYFRSKGCKSIPGERSQGGLGCGIHIHIDAAYLTDAPGGHDVNPLNGRHTASVGSNIDPVIRLTKMVHAQDQYLQAMLGNGGRRNWCRPVQSDLLRRIKHAKTADDINVALFNSYSRNAHSTTRGRRPAGSYDQAVRSAARLARGYYPQQRYCGVNLLPLATIGTVEFRLFNGTLHAGKVRANILLALAMAHFAKNAKRVSSKQKEVSNNMKYDCRTWLNRLGMIGDDFKTARLHLTGRKSRLEGCSSRANRSNETQLAA